VEVPFLGQILGANINLLITLKREDGGTPGFLQVIKTALVIQLKEKMGIQNILKREHEIVDYVFSQLGSISKNSGRPTSG
jgi:selenocysteine lyase/cysteine desulfurase